MMYTTHTPHNTIPYATQHTHTTHTQQDGPPSASGGATELLTELQQELTAAHARHAAAQLAAGRMQEELAAVNARLHNTSVAGGGGEGEENEEEMQGEEETTQGEGGKTGGVVEEMQGEQQLLQRRAALCAQHTAAQARVEEIAGEVRLLEMQVHDLEAMHHAGMDTLSS